jgi:hypothetical protein
MSETMYAVKVSKNGRKTTEVVAAKNAFRAGDQVREENPNAIVYNVDTL